MRSLLFVPGNSVRMILKAHDSAADALILDLEDAVAPDQKDAARENVANVLREVDFGEKDVFVRINPLTTKWGLDDARAVAASGAPGVLIPKVENVDAITSIAPVMQSRDRRLLSKRQSQLLCLIESPRGVLACREIAEASELVVGLIFGSADLSRELGCTLSEDESEVLFARSQVLLAARASGVAAYDSPHFTIEDLAGLRRRSQASRNLGYDGKTIIHPSHIEIVNEVFVPTAAQIASAQRVVDAMNDAHARGRGAISLDGKMIDQVHLTAARKVLEQAR